MRIKYFLLIFLTFLFACSPFSNKAPEPELRNLLVELTNKYLTNIAQGKIDKTAQMIYWEEFLGNGDERISKEEFIKQFQSIAKTWKPQEIPFLGLSIKKITADESDAEVILEKKLPDSKYPSEFWVKLYWAGTAWTVKEDSLFGKNKFLDKYANKQ